MSMSYKEFQEMVRPITKGDTKLQVTWVTGGLAGGSCWASAEEDPYYPLDPEPEPEFTELDELLELVCPNVTFLQYKSLYRDVVKYTEKYEREYYGNRTDYGVKTVELQQLYDALVIRGLL